MATDRQISLITTLRAEAGEIIPAAEWQISAELTAHLLWNEDAKQAGKAAAQATEDNKAEARSAATKAFRAAHPVESYLDEARALLARDAAQYEADMTGDVTALSTQEASALIDRLKAPSITERVQTAGPAPYNGVPGYPEYGNGPRDKAAVLNLR